MCRNCADEKDNYGRFANEQNPVSPLRLLFRDVKPVKRLRRDSFGRKFEREMDLGQNDTVT
jgi:hypothetical protein